MDNYIENILAENLMLKTKLDSKCEAIRILQSEVEKCKVQKDQYKESLGQVIIKGPNCFHEPDASHNDVSRALRLEVESLRQKLRDALGDVQALRCKLNSERSNNATDEDKKLMDGEEFARQLEELQLSKVQLQADLQAALDEKEELVVERDAYKCKLHRLNHECNVLLQGNTNSIVDLDALITENRLLQERLIQAQEDCQKAKQVSQRYKNMLHTRNKKGVAGETSDLFLSKEQVETLLEYCGTTEVPGPDATVEELRSLCVTLIDVIRHKKYLISFIGKANSHAPTNKQLKTQLQETTVLF